MSNHNPKKHLRAIALMGAVTSYLVGPIIVGILGGRWLDSYIDTAPLFMIIGLLLGLATGVYGLIRLLKDFLGEDT